MKILGIDMDGVLNNMDDVFVSLIKKEFGINVDETKYNLLDDLDISKKQIGIFFRKYHSDLYNKTKLQWEAKSVVNDLYDRYKIYIITARAENLRNVTKEWLDNNNILYDRLYMDAGKKAELCKKLNVDIMIDDAPENIKQLVKNKVNCFVFDKTYNREIANDEYVTRVYDWKDIKDRLT